MKRKNSNLSSVKDVKSFVQLLAFILERPYILFFVSVVLIAIFTLKISCDGKKVKFEKDVPSINFQKPVK